MISELIAHPWWWWLSLGGLLLAAEMLGFSGYLLWSGVAAILVGLLVWLVPLAWAWQGLSFAVLTVLAALWWHRWLKHRDRRHPPSQLNQRGQQLTGQRLILETPLVNGIGHIRVGDGQWRVQAEEDLPAGTPVIVTAVEGITLRIARR